MRGPLTTAEFNAGTSGIIPAYAGTTRPPGARRPTRPDHPRLCGDHRHKRVGARHKARIIPAYAGTTTHITIAPKMH